MPIWPTLDVQQVLFTELRWYPFSSVIIAVNVMVNSQFSQFALFLWIKTLEFKNENLLLAFSRIECSPSI